MWLLLPRAPPVSFRSDRAAVPLADRAIGNLQQRLIGAHHGVSKGQLQVYLDEFVFRHNRRKTLAAAFQTLVGSANRETPDGREIAYFEAPAGPDSSRYYCTWRGFFMLVAGFSIQ